ncbi:MAG: FAD binding domain-containing protein [Ardenticatenaceae bacterium]
MYPAKFDYVRAGSVAEAVSLLQQHGDDAKVLAGGHSLLPAMKLRLSQPAVLIDIGRIAELRGIEQREDGSLRIGALTTYAEIAADEQLQQSHAALTDACSVIGDAQVRNCGTIGGNLSHNDPASDLPAVALALNATLHVTGSGGARAIPADEFIVGLLETALAADEIVTAVEFPAPGEGAGSAYVKFENPASGYAICGVAAAVRISETRGGPSVEDVRVAVNGALDHARRLTAVEDALRGGPHDMHDVPSESAAQHAADGLNEGDFMSDIHADAAYRVHLTRVLTRRALEKAVTRARG